MPTERRRIFYTGRVQGVGFRYTCERLARGFDVSGWVRNLPDGRVELVAQGEGPAVDAFLRAVDGELGDKIRSSHVEVEPVTDPSERGFVIRY